MVLVQMHEVLISTNLSLNTSIALYFFHQPNCLGRFTEAPEDISLRSHSEMCRALYWHSGGMWHHTLRPLAPTLLHSQGWDPITFNLYTVLYQQIGCFAPNHHIRDKRESEGDSPCTGEGEIGVYVFKELELCPNGCGNIPFVLCTFSEFTLTEWRSIMHI